MWRLSAYIQLFQPALSVYRLLFSDSLFQKKDVFDGDLQNTLRPLVWHHLNTYTPAISEPAQLPLQRSQRVLSIRKASKQPWLVPSRQPASPPEARPPASSWPPRLLASPPRPPEELRSLTGVSSWACNSLTRPCSPAQHKGLTSHAELTSPLLNAPWWLLTGELWSSVDVVFQYSR